MIVRARLIRETLEAFETWRTFCQYDGWETNSFAYRNSTSLGTPRARKPSLKYSPHAWIALRSPPSLSLMYARGRPPFERRARSSSRVTTSSAPRRTRSRRSSTDMGHGTGRVRIKVSALLRAVLHLSGRLLRRLRGLRDGGLRGVHGLLRDLLRRPRGLLGHGLDGLRGLADRGPDLLRRLVHDGADLLRGPVHGPHPDVDGPARRAGEVLREPVELRGPDRRAAGRAVRGVRGQIGPALRAVHRITGDPRGRAQKGLSVPGGRGVRRPHGGSRARTTSRPGRGPRGRPPRRTAPRPRPPPPRAPGRPPSGRGHGRGSGPRPGGPGPRRRGTAGRRSG